MRRVRTGWAAAAAFGLLTASMACGAQGIRIIRPGGSAVMLLTTPGVQKELKLTEEQITKAKAMSDKARQEMQEFFATGLQGAAPEEVQEILDKKRAEMDSEQAKALKSLLSADQMKRLKQLDLQQAGVAGMMKEETAKALNLTEAQKGKLRSIEEEAQEQLHEIFQSAATEEPAPDANGQVRRSINLNGEAAKKLQALREKATAKGLEVLTEDQKKTYKELTGEPFKFEPPAPPKAGKAE